MDDVVAIFFVLMALMGFAYFLYLAFVRPPRFLSYTPSRNETEWETVGQSLAWALEKYTDELDQQGKTKVLKQIFCNIINSEDYTNKEKEWVKSMFARALENPIRESECEG